MERREVFNQYRQTLLEWRAIQDELEALGTDGQPAGIRRQSLEEKRMTNDASAALRQLAEGLEARAAALQGQLDAMRSEVNALLSGIRCLKTFMAVQRYYLLGETDMTIGVALQLSRQRVCQLRQAFMQGEV